MELDERRIKGAALHRNLLIVIVGHDRNSSFLIYRDAMRKLALTPNINKSFLYFGAVQPLDRLEWLKRNEIKKLPILLVFYQNRLVAKIDKFPGKSRAVDFLEQVAFRCLIYSLEDQSADWYFDKLGLAEDEKDSSEQNDKNEGNLENNKTNGSSNLNQTQFQKLFRAFNDLREHTIYFTQRMPIFDDTINHKGNRFVQNQINKSTYFDTQYSLNDIERTIFLSMISLVEDDFNYVYMPSNEHLVNVESIERPDQQALLYIHSRRYNVTHAMTDGGKFLYI